MRNKPVYHWRLGLLILVLVLATALGTAGCRKKAAPAQPAPATPQPAPAPAAEKKAPEPPAPELKTVEQIAEYLSKLPPAERRQKLVDGAKKEGKVVTYSTSSLDSLEDFKKDFEAKYPGITLEFMRGGTGDIVEKTRAEAKAGVFLVDVHDGGSTVPTLYTDGLIAKHFGVPIPADIPKAVYSDWYSSVRGLGVVIAFNTKMVKPEEAPKTWADLLDPKWKGKVGIDTQVGTYRGLVVKWGLEEVEKWIKGMIDNGAVIREGARNKPELLLAGEYAITPTLWVHYAEGERLKGNPIDWVIPEFAPFYTQLIAIAKDAPHPYAALLYLEYLQTVDTQQIVAKSGDIPVNPKVTYSPRVTEFLNHPQLYVPDVFEVETALKEFPKMAERIFIKR
ncbi:MAG: extracellular solute-binding protein [Firmicutes bacterium]|nr:extracellular solute-binding protein [Bacillota bacterium]